MNKINKTVYLLFLFFISFNLFGKTKIIEGYIKDSTTGEVVQFASIYEVNNKRGTTSDVNGFFKIVLKKNDTLLIEITHLNYLKYNANYVLKNDTNVIFNLTKKISILEEVTVSTFSKSKFNNSSITILNKKQINNITSIGGEKDVLKSMQNSPGVQSGIEGSIGLNVRGGGSDQNLFLIDNMSIYSPSHLFGFFSTFNTDMIKSAELVRAGMPANYGGKLSSLLNITTNKPSYENYNSIYSIGLISSKYYSEIPIVKNKSGLLISLRRSFFDLISYYNAKFENQSEFNKIGFYDIYLKYNHLINNQSEFSINYLKSKDNFYDIFNSNYDIADSKDISGINWSNDALFANYKYKFNENTIITVFSGIHNYQYNYINEKYFSAQLENSYQKSTSIKDISSKLELEKSISSSINLIVGVEYINHNLIPINVIISKKNFIITNESSNELSCFAQSDYYINDNQTLSAGLRQTYYKSGKMLFKPIEPRLSYIYNIESNWEIKTSLSRNIQFIHMVEDFSTGFPIETWHISDQDILFENCYQVSSELLRHIKSSNLNLGTAIYYKWLSNLVDYGNYYSDFAITNNTQKKMLETNGKGLSYGIELFCNKNVGSFNYSVNYLLSRSIRRFKNINDNNWFSANYDKRHNLNLNLCNYSGCNLAIV